KGIIKFCDLPGAVVEEWLGSAQFGGRGLEVTKASAVIELLYLDPKYVDLFQHWILGRFKSGNGYLVLDVPASGQRADAEEERESQMKVPPHKVPSATCSASVSESK